MINSYIKYIYLAKHLNMMKYFCKTSHSDLITLVPKNIGPQIPENICTVYENVENKLTCSQKFKATEWKGEKLRRYLPVPHHPV